MSTTITPNMLLTVPVVGLEPGPNWASDINNCMTLIDQHDHTPGFGVQLTAEAINVNTTFPMNNNQITGIAAAVFTAQTSFATNLALYVIANDIYYRDGAGNQVRITQSGAVTGSAGTITGLPSGTASASYTALNQTFTFQSATSTAANLDAGSLIMRNLSPNSTFALTLEPPAALGSNYTVTLPTLPASTKIMTMTSSGVMAASYTVDNVTLDLSAGTVLEVKNLGIDTGQIAANAVTAAKIATDAVITAKIQDLAVTTAKLAAQAVTRTKIELGAVGNLQIDSNANIQLTQLQSPNNASYSMSSGSSSSGTITLLAAQTFTCYRGGLGRFIVTIASTDSTSSYHSNAAAVVNIIIGATTYHVALETIRGDGAISETTNFAMIGIPGTPGTDTATISVTVSNTGLGTFVWPALQVKVNEF